MALRPSLGKAGSTNLKNLRICPQYPSGHTGVAPNDPNSATYQALINGYYTGPSTANVQSAAASVNMYDIKVMGMVYTPSSNNAPTITAGAIGTVTFDSGTAAPFPMRPGDLIFAGTMANWGPSARLAEAFVYADPLNTLGLVVIGYLVVGAATTTACTVKAVVANTSGGSQTVPASWLPNLTIVRIEA